MKYKMHSFRHALEIFNTKAEFTYLLDEVKLVLENISDHEIIDYFNHQKRKAKSISETLNKLIDNKLIEKGWLSQSPIFKDKKFSKNKNWRLDFAKDSISIEVAFNHGEAVAWNLIKPSLASELNHVEKAIQTKAGIIICATNSFKKTGGFDGSVGSFEKYVEYLKPLNHLLTTPLLIIGLESPESFFIKVEKNPENKKIGKVILNN
ncbi:BglII/BstYI family type II restriction endonuclease [Gottfriedia sp. OAE603]|uniref:BglII/BstYI family type II restriction endonuclease n=1 Tax=Gottfriedia sp. OAE603 TaxID=2663872 RepID=UPI00178BF061